MTNNKNLVVIPITQNEISTDVYSQTIKELTKLGNRVILVDYGKGEKSFFKEKIRSNKIQLLQKIGQVYVATYYKLIPYFNLKYSYLLNILLYYTGLLIFLSVKDRQPYFFKSIFWTIHPWRKEFKFVSKLFAFSLYDCTDFIELKKNDIDKYIEQIRSFSWVFFNSQTLANLYGPKAENFSVVLQGFRSDRFSHHEKQNNKKLVVGFVGGVNDRLDYELLIKLASRFKELDFEIWGKVVSTKYDLQEVGGKIHRLSKFSNVKFDQCDRNDISKVISRFDLAIIPYKTDYLFNQYCYPMKLLEYFYHGKQIVSSDIIELRRFDKKGLIKIAKTESDWAQIINDFKNEKSQKVSSKNQTIMKKFAEKNNWKNKVSMILSKIKIEANI